MLGARGMAQGREGPAHVSRAWAGRPGAAGRGRLRRRAQAGRTGRWAPRPLSSSSQSRRRCQGSGRPSCLTIAPSTRSALSAQRLSAVCLGREIQLREHQRSSQRGNVRRKTDRTIAQLETEAVHPRRFSASGRRPFRTRTGVLRDQVPSKLRSVTADACGFEDGKGARGKAGGSEAGTVQVAA